MPTLKFLRMVTAFVVISLLTGCQTLQEMVIRSQNIYIHTDTIEGVIFNADILDSDSTKYYIYDENNRNPDSYWTPTEEDVLRLEANLPVFLKTKIPEGNYAYGLWDKLPEYTRQYVGYVIDGQRRIFANYFCDSYDSDYWKIGLVMVMDGGECFFHVLYRVDSQTFTILSVNGFA
jgi:hypothetical protein